MKELTFEELKAKAFMEDYFVPALHRVLSEANPVEYQKWQGNACRQTAILGAKTLSSLLPEYKWEAWDGIFSDVVLGRHVVYNHAWAYGVNRQEGRRLFVDLSRNHQERLFVLTDGNRYPKEHPEYVNLKETKREKIDIEHQLELKEYYTGLFGRELLARILAEARIASNAGL